MDRASCKRGAVPPRKAYSVTAIKGTTTESDQNSQFCNRIGCSGRIKKKKKILQQPIHFLPDTEKMEPSITESQPVKQIFILSGQSNMAGRGGVVRVGNHKHWDGVVPPESSPDSHRIFRLNAHLHWEEAREPLHHDIDSKKTCGVGPGMAFSNAVKERAGVIGLVPCAVGGTAIKEWARGEHLYENMVKRAKAAEHGGTIRALLWYQGESDATSQHNVDCYKENMEALIHNVRADLNLPSLPVIQVAIASGDSKFIDKIREIQKEINIPNVVCVDAIGSQLQEDNLHLTTEAQVVLGRMLADAYLANFE